VPAALWLLGTLIGASATFIGAGSDAIVLPALLYTRLFTPKEAVATSMAVFLLPVQALTVVRAYRAGDLAIGRAVTIALAFVAGNWVTADHFDVNGRTVRYATATTLMLTAVAVLFAPESFGPDSSYDIDDDDDDGEMEDIQGVTTMDVEMKQ
jgi:uncharacterized membrane protein YfcA